MDSFTIYLITRLQIISEISAVLSIVLLIGNIIFVVWRCVSIQEEEWYEIYKKAINIHYLLLILLVIAGLIATLTPTTKEMIGIIVIPRIINSQCMQDMPEDFVDLFHEWMLELKPTNILNKKAEAIK